ncbi:hypothetical protein ACIRF8_08740 [Streptomyces sp. NPDC102406]|uniref:hypothetical protein n=1 Tax=Streptomyces sp. NPDC102406 TaxID=3366171 RepID=UPI0037F4E9AE
MQVAALVRDAGLATDVEDRGRLLRTEVSNAGLHSVRPVLELALAFHHTVLADHDRITADLERLEQLSGTGDHVHCVDLVHFMDGRPLAPRPQPGANWLAEEQTVRERWRALVLTRRSLALLEGP